MPKDFKTGLFAGMLLVAAVSVWLATRPGLSLEPKTPNRQLLLKNDAGNSTDQPNQLPATSQNRETANNFQQVSTHTTSFPGQQKWYEVKKGDTLSAIAQEYGIRTRKLRNANRDIIKDINNIKPGTKLRIPD